MSDEEQTLPGGLPRPWIDLELVGEEDAHGDRLLLVGDLQFLPLVRLGQAVCPLDRSNDVSRAAFESGDFGGDAQPDAR